MNAAGIDDPLRIPPPSAGRVHGHRRRVHFADASPDGRVRLDAVARMLQDISDEDTIDAGFAPDEPWVVRRIELGVRSFPRLRDVVDVTTWCAGIGGRWAERRVRIGGAASGDDGGAVVDAAVLWVHLDASGRPARLPEGFEDVYGEAAGGRKVRARLHHGPMPEVPTEPFPLRFSDLDVMGHVNNAVSWVPVEEAIARRPELRAPLRLSLEYPAPIDPGALPRVGVVDVDGGFDLWISAAGRTCSTAHVRPWLDHLDSTGSGTSA